jgi:hypothetical protein
LPGTGQNHLYLPPAVIKPEILVSRAFPPPAGWKNLSKNRYLRVLLFVAKRVNITSLEKPKIEDIVVEKCKKKTCTG